MTAHQYSALAQTLLQNRVDLERLDSGIPRLSVVAVWRLYTTVVVTAWVSLVGLEDVEVVMVLAFSWDPLTQDSLALRGLCAALVALASGWSKAHSYPLDRAQAVVQASGSFPLQLASRFLPSPGWHGLPQYPKARAVPVCRV